MKKFKYIAGICCVSLCLAQAERTVSSDRLFDDFNRSVGASSQATLGTDVWMNGSSDGSQWGISDDQAFSNLRKGSVGLLINHALEMTGGFALSVEVKALADNRWAGLAFNCSDEKNYYYFRFKSGSENWVVQAVKDGSLSRLGAAGKLAAGTFKSGVSYTLTVTSTSPGQFDLKIIETESGAVIVADSRAAEDASEELTGGFGGLFQTTPGNGLVYFDNFSLKLLSPVLPASKPLGGFGFAPIFNNGSVLQCEMPVNIWGTATPGDEVTVSFAGQTKTAVADSSKHWKVVLDPMAASSEPRILQVSGSKFQVSLSDVLVGEVWLASGQSNMERTLKGSHNGPDRLAKTIPEIHFSIVPRKAGLPVAKDFSAKDLDWKSFSPESNDRVSAVAFYFAEQLQNKTGRHIGIIQSAYGGTPCEAWTPLGALETHPELNYFADKIKNGLATGKTQAEWMEEIRRYNEKRRVWNALNPDTRPTGPRPVGMENPWSWRSPTVLFENMIRPLIPYTVRGVIWYQGEANAGRGDEYRILFPAMINAWRSAWNRPQMPFFFVQLASYGRTDDERWKTLCLAQTFTRDTVENTGMALAIDCGDKSDIHPLKKKPVGERLARLALDQVYGQDIASRGPAFQTLEKKDGRVLVRFQWLEKGLQTSDGKVTVPGFELAGSDQVFHPAKASIRSDDSVEVISENVSDPAFIRYAWAAFPEPPVTLQNSAGLPAEPFNVTIKN